MNGNSAGSSELRQNWRVLLASFVGMACGINSLFFYSLGLFILPLANDFSWSRGEASLGALVAKIGAALAAPLVGWAIDRLGPRATGIGSLVGLGVGFMLLAGLTSGLGLYLVLMLAIAVAGLGSSPLGFGQLVVQSFHRQRGLALGIAITGTGVGGVLVPLLLTSYIAEAGWRAGYMLLGACALLAVPIVWLLLRGQPDQARPQVTTPGHPHTAGLYSDPVFWVLGAVFLTASLGVFGVLVHFVPLLTDAGVNPRTAGVLTSLVGASVMVSRIGIGWTLDRLPANLVAAAVFMLAAAGLLLLANFGVALAIPGALLVGLSIGAEIDLMAYIVSRHFDMARYGRAYGAIYGMFLVGAAISPSMVGYLFDFTGSYHGALITGGAALSISALLLTFALPRVVRGRGQTSCESARYALDASAMDGLSNKASVR
ncbi:MFS transporter [Bradyrhizobium sp. USDA 4469]